MTGLRMKHQVEERQEVEEAVGHLFFYCIFVIIFILYGGNREAGDKGATVAGFIVFI
jgi:hypothetical protein